MNVEHRNLARRLGRQKPWALVVMVGYAVAAVGFAVLPSVILTPVAPALIVGGFALSLAAWLVGRLRLSALRAIRREEQRGHWAV